MTAITRRKDSSNRVLKEGEYQRNNGTFEYKWRDRRGVRHSVYAKTLQELRDKERNILRDSLDGIRTEGKGLTVNDLYDRWGKLKKGIKPNTLWNYKFLYGKHIAPGFGNLHITDIRRSDVRDFYNTLTDKENLSAGTVSCIHIILHQVLELGVEDEYLRFNPADSALRELKRTHDTAPKRKRALTIPESDRFESFLARSGYYHRWQPIFTVMLWTGMRVGEVTGLTWSDIDFDEDFISINHTLIQLVGAGNGGKKYGYAINTPKTVTGIRTIPMLPKVRDAFIREREYQKRMGLTCNVSVDGYTDFVFLSRTGRPYDAHCLNVILKKIIRDCNREAMESRAENPILLPVFSSHTLRHTFTTRMCEAGVNIKVMQDVLGHADAQTTLQIYTDATRELKKSEMSSLGEYFNT